MATNQPTEERPSLTVGRDVIYLAAFPDLKRITRYEFSDVVKKPSSIKIGNAIIDNTYTNPIPTLVLSYNISSMPLGPGDARSHIKFGDNDIVTLNSHPCVTGILAGELQVPDYILKAIQEQNQPGNTPAPTEPAPTAPAESSPAPVEAPI